MGILMRQDEAQLLTTSSNTSDSKSPSSAGSSSSLWTTLPPELLLRIFQLVCASNPVSDRVSWLLKAEAPRFSFSTPSLDGNRSAPLAISWTCSLWRHLAISTPSLWTSISLGDPDPLISQEITSRCPLKDSKILDLYLSRVGDVLPLSIELVYDQFVTLATGSESDSQPADRTKDPDYFSGIRALALRLIPYRHRWRHVKLCFLLLSNLEPFLTSLAFPYGAPMLDYLDISTKFTFTLQDTCSLDFTGCPRLRSLIILCPEPVSGAVTRLRESESTSLANLTYLELRMCQSQEHVLAWFSSCKNLDKVYIKLYDELFPSPELRPDVRSYGRIELPSLSELTLHSFCNVDPGPKILDSLVLPKLKNLDIAMWQSWENMTATNSSRQQHQSWPFILRLLQRAPDAPLERLSLIGVPMNTSEIIQVLDVASISSVRHSTLFKNPYLGSPYQGGVAHGEEKGVRELVLGGASIMEEVLERISGVAIGDNSWDQLYPLLPKLESLELKNVSCTSKSILNLVQSRARLYMVKQGGSVRNADLLGPILVCNGSRTGLQPSENSSGSQFLERDNKFRTLKQIAVCGSKNLLDELAVLKELEGKDLAATSAFTTSYEGHDLNSLIKDGSTPKRTDFRCVFDLKISLSIDPTIYWNPEDNP